MSSKRAPATDWTGQTLYGKWTVERLIGVGGTSTVLQARHRNGRRAALKILHPHLAAHGRTRERFLREGRLANLVQHPGVVAVLDDFMTDDGSAVLVLELVSGQTLAAVAKDAGGFLDPREVVTASRTVLEILAVAHDANVIHRDIKPENIMRSADGAFKLADFGLAALHHELGMLTGANMALGTPAYMSPEQARGNALDIDSRTDIWGLGATMFTLLTSRYLHATSASRNLVVAAATEPVQPILTLEPTMYPPLAAIIERAVRMDKEERWPNARAMLAELATIEVPDSEIRPRPAAIAEGSTMSTAASSLHSWSRAGRSFGHAESRSKRLIAGAVLAIAATLAVAIAAFRSSSRGASSDDAAVEPSLVRAAPPPASVASVSATSAAPVAVLRPEAPLEPARIESPSPSRVAIAKPRPAPAPSVAPAVSAPPRAPDIVRELDLSVPDDVLDRRE